MKRSIPLCLAAWLCLALPTPARAQTPQEEEEYAACDRAVAILKGGTVSLDFRDAPIGTVVRFLAEKTGVNLVLDPQVAEAFANEGKFVNLQVTHLVSYDALTILLRFNGLAWAWRNGIIFITTPDRMAPKLSLRVYDVDGLVRRILDRPGSVGDLLRAYSDDRASRSEDGSESGAGSALAPEDLRTMIRESIATETWEGSECRIAALGNRLLVNQSREAHDRIRELLRSVEACVGPSIGIRARILEVPPAALDAAGPGPLLTDAQVAALEKAAAGLPQSFPQCRLAAVNGRRNHFAAGRDFLFLAGKYDGQPRQKAARDGVVLDVQPLNAQGEGVPAIVRLFASTADTTSEKLARMPFLRVGTTVVVPRTGWLLLSAGTLRAAADGEAEAPAVVALLAAEVGEWPRPESYVEKTDPGVKAIQTLIAGKTLSADYMDTPLKAVAADLAERLGVNIILDPKVYESKSEDELLVQLRVDAIPAGELLRLLLGLKGLDFVIESGVILVTTQEGAMRSAAMDIIPVHDLVARLPRFDAAWPAFPPREPAPAALEEEEEVDEGGADGLICLLKENVAPETWDTPPNWISNRQSHFFVYNQPPVLAKANSLLDSLRLARWRRVAVDGRFVAAPPGWAEGLGVRGAVLTPAQCDAVEKALSPQGPAVRDRFRIHGCAERRFSASGGRQLVYATSQGPKGDFDTAAAVDGWCAEIEAAPATDKGRMTLRIRARASAYRAPGDLLADSGEMSSAEYGADLRLEDGGGALLGGASPGDARGGSSLLYVRARFVE